MRILGDSWGFIKICRDPPVSWGFLGSPFQKAAQIVGNVISTNHHHYASGERDMGVGNVWKRITDILAEGSPSQYAANPPD